MLSASNKNEQQDDILDNKFTLVVVEKFLKVRHIFTLFSSSYIAFERPSGYQNVSLTFPLFSHFSQIKRFRLHFLFGPFYRITSHSEYCKNFKFKDIMGINFVFFYFQLWDPSSNRMRDHIPYTNLYMYTQPYKFQYILGWVMAKKKSNRKSFR